MTKSLAVAVIHGMGSHGAKRPDNSASPTYSKDLHARIRKEIGKTEFDEKIAWREIFWSDVLQERQDKFLKKIKRRTRFDEIRSFVVHNLGDAAGYQYTGDSNNTYKNIHARVSETIRELDSDTVKDAPLIVFAHSLGCHVISNYVYDMSKAPVKPTKNFQQLRTMAGFLTFGCNIPLFTFTYDEEKIFPIRFPGTNLPPELQVKPWWLNYHDKDDVLGYPLQFIGPKYEDMVTNGDLQETAVNVGSFFQSWNPASHNGYWRDDEFYEPAARFLKKFL